ncbi:DUF1634 domain-containing protein [Taibaiella koreensis]|uniref:DUF1634 domain-containing protein n=1 Tax=Taibaiella koreensis TaxID=1268548 RepID=UPI000E59ED05|nr:DUF1634 domain-containing protein [Taibaiella koreensis]
MKSFQDKDLQSFIGNLLRLGVMIAMAIVVAGLLLYLFQHGRDIADYSTFDEHGIFRPAVFWQALRHGDSKAIMELGVIALIATPIARVLFTMIGFWLEKDRRYTLIALVVLCIIAYSLFFGVAGH